MPSDRDRYLTSLRALARRLYRAVDKVLKLDPTDDERVTAGGGMRHPAVSCARYQLPLGITLNSLPVITFLRIPARPTVPIERLVTVGASPPKQTRCSSRPSGCGRRGLLLLKIGCCHESDAR